MRDKLKKSFEFYALAFFMLENLILCWTVHLTVKDRNSFILEANLMVFLAAFLLYYLLTFLKKYKAAEREGIRFDWKGYFSDFDVAYIFVLLLIVCGIISVIFAVDRTTALYGEYARDEGLYAWLSYYMLFFVASKIKDESERNELFLWFMFLGLLICIEGVMSGWGWLSGISTKGWTHMAYIPFGNPNTYGTFCSTIFAGMAGLFLYANERKYRIFAWIGVVISAGAVFASSSSSPIVGNIIVFCYALIFYITMKVKKIPIAKFRGIVLGVVYFVTMIVSNITRGGAVAREFAANMREFSTGHVSFSNRLDAWIASFKLMPKYWLTGVGVDCFRYAMANEGVPAYLSNYDKAHNEYVQIMITEGVFAITVYLVLLFVLFFRSRKQTAENLKKNAYLPLTLFLMFISYLAQAFFNFSVPWVACYFWIILGLFAG